MALIKLLGRMPVVAAATLIGVGVLAGSAGAQQQTTLTVWAWASAMPDAIKAYEAAHPDVKVELVHPGGAPEQFMKLRNADRAGSGSPDVAQITFAMINAFTITNSVSDLSGYGLGKYEGEYANWMWSFVKKRDKVWSLPWDSGPMALIYRKDIQDQQGLAVPKTWAEFKEVARKLKAADPDTFMANMNFGGADWIQGILWQGGVRPFKIDGETIEIAVNTPRAKEILGYWQELFDEKLVEAMPFYTPEWFAAMDSGRYYTFIGTKWFSNTMMRNAKESMGKWRAADLPQWNEGEFVSANWGGSLLIVPEGAQNKEAAARFIEWLMHDPAGVKVSVDLGLWPSMKSVLNDPAFRSGGHPLYGDTPVNEVFVRSAAHIATDWQYSPFQDYADSQFIDVFSQAAAGKMTFVEALDRLQAIFVEYAKQQGFTVKEG